MTFCLLNNPLDAFLFLFGGIFEGVTDCAGDHGFEFLFLLNFIAVKSD